MRLRDLQVILEQEGALQKVVGVEFVKDSVTLRLENVRRDVVFAAGMRSFFPLRYPIT